MAVTQPRERRGVPVGGRFIRLARHEVSLPEEMTGEPDTDAQFCFGVAKQIAEAMRMRQTPTFTRERDGSMLAKLDLGPKRRPYTVRISGAGQHVTVKKLSRDQRNNPYDPEALATSTFEVDDGPASPAQLGDMITDSFQATRWWQ